MPTCCGMQHAASAGSAGLAPRPRPSPARAGGHAALVLRALQRWGPFCLALAVLGFGMGASLSVAWGWYALLGWPRRAAALLGLTYFLGGMCLWSFLVASFRSPGYTSDLVTPTALEQGDHSPPQQQQQESAGQDEPAGPEEDEEEGTESTPLLATSAPVLASGLGVKARGGQRWCSKCKLPKPDRTHHCRVCNKCILRMDHHCPWLASSCVGWRTYKAFVLFLVHASLLCLTLVGATGTSLWRLWLWPSDRRLPHAHVVVQTALGIVALVFAIPISLFTLFHMHLLLHNKTTIENLEGGNRIRPSPKPGSPSSPAEPEGAETLSKQEKARLRARAREMNVYDLGGRSNFIAVFGPRWTQWWRPNTPPEGNGTAFLVDPAKLAELRAIEARLAPDGPARHAGQGTPSAGQDASQSLRDALRALPQ